MPKYSQKEELYGILISRIRGGNVKLMIASDIHGSAYYMEKLKIEIEKEAPDKVVLLGDLYYHGPRNSLPKGYDPKRVALLLNQMARRLEVVKGNCDAEVDEMISQFKFYRSITMNIDGKKVFFTHGHLYDRDHLPDQLVDVMIYGHTHVGWIEEKNGIIFANPGSVSIPKQGTEHSYLILNDNALILKKLDGTILKTKFLS